MELKNVTVLKKHEVEAGTSKTGNAWQKQVVIVETSGSYPKKIALTFFGDIVYRFKDVAVGQTIDCMVDIESREYNNKYYTDVNCWKYTTLESAPQPHQVQKAKEAAQLSDDLPF